MKTDIEIKAGSELDMAVAEAVGVSAEQFNTFRHLHWPNVNFQYSTNLNESFAAASAVGLWREYGYCEASGQHVISKTVPVASWEDTIANAETPALAICAAILELERGKVR